MASVAVAVAAQDRTAQAPGQAPPPAMGGPVNIYARNGDPYAPPAQDGQIHPWHVRGQVWLMAGEPDQSNVAVHLGDLISGEEAAQQRAFGSGGTEVFAHENVLAHMVTESSAAGATPRELWPSDTEGFEIDNRRFNDEPIRISHPRTAYSDGQLLLLSQGYQGRDFKLTDVHGKVVEQLFA